MDGIVRATAEPATNAPPTGLSGPVTKTAGLQRRPPVGDVEWGWPRAFLVGHGGPTLRASRIARLSRRKAAFDPPMVRERNGPLAGSGQGICGFWDSRVQETATGSGFALGALHP